MQTRKKIIFVVLISILLIGVLGASYAVFSYSKIGSNQELITGDIYMHYNETNTLTLSNAMPSSTYDPTKYFEFTIDGKNTNSKYDIYYDINLLHGDVPDGKTEENRILDKFLKFRLTEFVENETTHELVETEIFTNKSYSDLSSAKRIHVDTISKNTMSEVTHRYRLYMWISNDVVIGNSENPNKDYDQSVWNNLFASIKVRATGDFEEKYTTTSPSCFTTELTYANATLNTNMTSGELQACVNYLTDQWGPEEEGNTVDVGETYQAFCNGTGTYWGNTFQERLDNILFESYQLEYFAEHNIISAEESISITGYVQDTYELNTNMTSEEVQTCVNYLTDERGPEEEGNTVDVGETYEAFCNGTGTLWGGTFQDSIDWGGFNDNELEYFAEHNIISFVERPSICNTTDIIIPSTINGNSVTTIGDFAFQNNQLSSVVIPNSVTTIGTQAFTENQLTSVTLGNSVTTIGDSAFQNNQLSSVVIPNSVTTIGSEAFTDNQLTSVTLGNSVTTIGDTAFSCNKLTSVTISNSVTTIGNSAFSWNQLTSVTIGNSVATIGDDAFYENQLTSVTIPDSVTTIGSSAFSWNQLTSVEIGNGITSIKYSAFFKSNSTYTSNGITYYNNPNLSSITIDKSCNDIKNNLKYNNTNYYPWLSSSSPYTGSYSAGTTIYGSNGEVCNAY